jgi:hypothetical protein
VLAHSILKSFRTHFAKYCAVSKSRTNIQSFWSINGSLELLRLLRQFRTNHKITSIVTGDFSAMFTALPHSCIMENIKFIVSLCFKNSGKQYIRVNRGECYYTDDGAGVTFRKEEVLDLIGSIVDSAYVKFAGCVYKQVSGVPMGSNCSPLLADLTLLALEFKYCMKAKPRFTVFRYVDDVLVLNCPNFEQLVPEIYPPELILSVTSSQNCAPFLDMRLELRLQSFTSAGTTKPTTSIFRSYGMVLQRATFPVRFAIKCSLPKFYV